MWLLLQTHSQWPADVPAVASEQEHTPSSHQRRRSRGDSVRTALQTCTGSNALKTKKTHQQVETFALISCICSFTACEQRQKGHSSRAHSAINDEAGSAVPRDRHHLLDIFSRPNTTHTYRVRCPQPHIRCTPCHRWYAWPTCLSVCPPAPSRTLRTAAPSQCWTTLGRDGQAEPLWLRVRNLTWLV